MVDNGFSLGAIPEFAWFDGLNILSHVTSTYETGFRLDDWLAGFSDTLYVYTVRDYRQYNDIAILHNLQFTVAHALGFSVFPSRILATVLSVSL
jgi:hypothetical protein